MRYRVNKLNPNSDKKKLYFVVVSIFVLDWKELILNYRSSKKEAAKEEARKNEIQELKDALRDLFIQTEEQGAHIRELSRKLGALGS